MREREALVARLRKHADFERDDPYGNPHVEKLCRDAIAALTAPQQEPVAELGCDYQGSHFGATYEDACCIDGYLWDLDSCDEPGGPLRHGGEIPCPKCNAQDTAPQSDGVVVPRETLKVYKSAPNYRDYLTARFKDRLDVSFEWNGKRYRYLHTDFDDTGDFDVLLAAAKEPR